MFTREVRHTEMTRIRKATATRLKHAKNHSLLSSVWDEIDMSVLLELQRLKRGSENADISFFIKAVCIALQEQPNVNARILDNEIIYFSYCDISVAISAPAGLFVPVIRNAESMNLAELKDAVFSFGVKAFRNKLAPSDMEGGTFTISNGGLYGSLLSLPLINPPQSAILGLHKICEKPIVIGGMIAVKPVMYATLTYDQRVIDAEAACSFLGRVKELVESPELLY